MTSTPAVSSAPGKDISRQKPVSVAILGASGYTGAELVRLLRHHPGVELAILTADRRAGETMDRIFPHLGPHAGARPLPVLTRIDEASFESVEAVFMALPHGTTQHVAAGLPSHVKVVDLSADFRLADPESYRHWYGHPHAALDLQKEAVYGLTEFDRDRIASARLIANPGCYPTSCLLPLVPLLQEGLIDPDDIVIDAKSGVTGAGRAASEATLFAEVSGGIHPYGIGHHRHMPEIEQELLRAAGGPVSFAFTPHLMPMNRGILSTIYLRLAGKNSTADLRAALTRRFAKEPFVRVLGEGQVPATRHVRGSNHCLIGVFEDRRQGRAIIVSVIDNLVKGASGQAIQNFNLAFGFEETLGLEQEALFP